MSSLGGHPDALMTYGPETDLALPALGQTHLGVDVRLSELQFRWSEDGTHWSLVGSVLDASILSDEAGPSAHGSFTGAFVRMAAHDISGRAVPADFDFFADQEV